MARSNSTRRNTAFNLPFAPTNRLDANRWLNKATFGPATGRVDLATSTKTTINYLAGEEDDAIKLMRVGYTAYVNEQMVDNSIVSALTAGPLHGYHDDNQNNFNAWWFSNAIHASAAIRFKASYALSQIFAAKKLVQVGQDELYRYYDYLLDATLSTNTNSYKTLLSNISYSHLMAAWLTYDGNKRADPTTFQKPDENYAREILQLFSIGTTILNIDGTNKLDTNGNPIPTYSNEDIRQLAKIFTGTFVDQTNNVAGKVAPIARQDAVHFHDMDAKVLLAYPDGTTYTTPVRQNIGHVPENPIKRTGYAVTVVTDTNNFIVNRTNGYIYVPDGLIFYKTSPNGSVITATRVNTGDNYLTEIRINKATHGLVVGSLIYIDSPMEDDINLAVDWISNHPNVAPFISKSLIKLMVCSNPSPEYVKRVALKFNDNGNGVRGDIASVVKAMLLDRECILKYGINPNNFGKYTSVLDKILKTWRAFRNDVVGYVKEDSDSYTSIKDMSKINALTKPLLVKDYTTFYMGYTNSIMPMQTPSVFNFYRPGFTPPGAIGLGALKLTAPELQLVNIDTQITWANMVSCACDTIKPEDYPMDSPGNGVVDPRYSANAIHGLDFSPHPSGWAVTNIDTVTNILTLTGTLVNSFTRRDDVPARAFMVNRRTKQASGAEGGRQGPVIFFVNPINDNPFSSAPGLSGTSFNPVAGGPQTIKISRVPAHDVVVGDVFDIASLVIIGWSGIGSGHSLNSVATPAPTQRANYTLYHKVALLVPNTVGIPTNSDLDASINYLESILLDSPMSSVLKSIVYQAGQAPVVDSPPIKISGSAAFENHYLNLKMTIAQKRARHMIAMILISPEYQANR